MRYYIKQFYCLSDSGFPLPAEVCLLFLLKEVSALGSLLLVSNQVLVQWFKELMVSRYRLSTVWNLVSTQEPAAVIVPPQHTAALTSPLLHKKQIAINQFQTFQLLIFCFTKQYFLYIQKEFLEIVLQDIYIHTLWQILPDCQTNIFL